VLRSGSGADGAPMKLVRSELAQEVRAGNQPRKHSRMFAEHGARVLAAIISSAVTSLR
jgi:hypothetical protein